MSSSKTKSDIDRKSHMKIYDDMILKVRKDAEINGDFIRAYAKDRGESVNGFLIRAVTETIKRDESFLR